MFLILLFTVSCSGCSLLLHPVEFAKVLWGSSTKELEEGRKTAITKTYHCSVDECFNAVLKLTEKPKEDVYESEILKPLADDTQVKGTSLLPETSLPGGKTSTELAAVAKPSTPHFDLYIKNRPENLLVVMGVPDCVNTTEVGIFFTPLDAGNVKLELSSMSTKAKNNASKIIFEQLNKQFPEI